MTRYLSLHSNLTAASILGLFSTLCAQGGFGPQQIITTAGDHPTSVVAADLDGDGDMDVVSGTLFDPVNHLTWRRNDGAGNFGPAQVITTGATGTRDIEVADLDGDGDLDLLVASFLGLQAGPNVVSWYANDGLGNFGPQQIINPLLPSAISVAATDLNGDGNLDVLATGFSVGLVVTHMNLGGGAFGPENPVNPPFDPIGGAQDACAADMDGDGDIDILTAARNDGRINFHENLLVDPLFGPLFFPAAVITSDAASVWKVIAADMDGDGDQDVLASSGLNNDPSKIFWMANDGTGSFGQQVVVTTDVDGPQALYATDLDGDGDLDILSGSSNKVTWYTNDGAGNFGAQQVITSSVINAESVYAADLNGDGNLDALSASNLDDKVAWYDRGPGGAKVIGTGCGAPLPLSLESTIPGLGRSWDLTIYGPLSGMWVFYLGDQVVDPGIPVPVGNHVGCSVYTNANIYVAMQPTLGFTANLSIAVPNYPALLGFTCAVQATSAAAGGGFFTSNGVQATLGY